MKVATALGEGAPFSLRSPLTEPPSVIDVACWPLADLTGAAANVCFWPLAEVAVVSVNVRFQGKGGRGAGAARLSASDPERTCPQGRHDE
jgi:hypothetical protein